MKLRTPGWLFITLSMLIILGILMTVIPVDFLPENGLKNLPRNTINQFRNIFSHWIVWAILAISLVLLLIINEINKLIERAKFKKLSPEEQAAYLEKKEQGYIKTLLRSSRERQTAEEEQELILDHGFDGITELDNALPQWWVAMFYLGIVYMIVYLVAYFTTDFADPIEEYQVETALLETRFAEWVKNNDITIDEAQNLYQDETALAHGKEIFTNICATCHTQNGGGAAGPNLTDGYWINKLNDSLYYNIYAMVYDGSPNNPAMQAFGQTNQLTGLDIQDVASYVYTLNQELPPVTEEEGGLAPQGDFIPEWSDKDGPVPDLQKDVSNEEAEKKLESPIDLGGNEAGKEEMDEQTE